MNLRHNLRQTHAARLEERYIPAADEQLVWDQLPDAEPPTPSF